MNLFTEHQIWQAPRYTGFKILALLLALTIWLYVTVKDNPLSEATYSVPVEIRNLSDDLSQPENNYQVQIRVQGQAALINEITGHDLVAYVDLQGMEAGEVMPKIEVSLPENVTLISLSPDSVQLSLEPKVQEAFPLEVKVSGAPAEHYRVLDPVLSPELVTVSGSAPRIAEIGSVFVSAEIGGLTENYNRNLSVEVLDKEGNNITQYFTLAPNTVNVVLPVVYDQPEATIAVRAATTGTPAMGYQVSRIVVEPSSVRAFGDLDTLDSLYYLETEVIDITGIRTTTSFTARVVHGGNISLATDYVTVVVQIEPVATASFTRELIHTQGLAETLSCNIPHTMVDVVVAGPDTYISGLNEADIVPYVDCTGITEPGEYELPVQVSLPNNLSLVEASPLTVKVHVVEASSLNAPQDE